MKRNEFIMDKARTLSDYFGKDELSLSSEPENSISIYSFETVLYQNPYGEIPKRPYTLNDLTTAQNLLAIFSLLETIKYKENIVNARPLLHKYLYSGYDWDKCLLNKITADVHLHIKIDINSLLTYGNFKYTYEDEKNNSYPKSIRKYFESYLDSRTKNTSCPDIHLIISTQDYDNKDRPYQPRYYLPVNQILEFLLEFAFLDGRIFSAETEDNASSRSRIPKFNAAKQKSELKYRLVLQQIEKILESHKLSNYEKISHAYKLDKIFLFHNMKTLNYYYTTYTSSHFLNRMIKVFELSYEEITNLKEIINKCIWDDSDFIHAGHQSTFMDFMLPFDIYFQYNLFCKNPYIRLQGIKGLEGLKEIIKECKMQARKIWEFPFHTDLQEILSINNNLLDIKKTQDNIVKILETNNFYKNYFLFENKYWRANYFSSEKLQYPISYDTLKLLLPQ